MMMITPLPHERAEWARMAQAAYAAGRNDVGHRFSAAAALRNGVQIPVHTFDQLQTQYRAWLVSGFDDAVHTVTLPDGTAHPDPDGDATIPRCHFGECGAPRCTGCGVPLRRSRTADAQSPTEPHDPRR